MTPAVPLGWVDLALAASFMLVAAGLTLLLRLGITRSFLIAAARMTAQLLLVGQLLTWLFAQASPWLTLSLAALMLLVAGYEVTARQERRLRHGWSYLLGTATMSLACSLVLFLALTTQIRPQPWYDPRYAIPLFGMILGNAMTGIALGLNGLTARLEADRRAIEAQLLLGADRWRALRPSLRHALRTGFMPIVNAMAATGVVALPGMMTGQILAGAAPSEAVKYQLLILFLIAGATSFGVIVAVMGTAWRLTDPRDRLRLDRLRSK